MDAEALDEEDMPLEEVPIEVAIVDVEAGGLLLIRRTWDVELIGHCTIRRAE